MRYDQANPCGDPEELICKGIWDSYAEGTLGDPSYRLPIWPSSWDQDIDNLKLIDGKIMRKSDNAHIGNVNITLINKIKIDIITLY
tara:strand:- start:1998 stop:2255 length:258 start_codon:yes stop_codon:yes gene_type:complete